MSRVKPLRSAPLRDTHASDSSPIRPCAHLIGAGVQRRNSFSRRRLQGVPLRVRRWREAPDEGSAKPPMVMNFRNPVTSTNPHPNPSPGAGEGPFVAELRCQSGARKTVLAPALAAHAVVHEEQAVRIVALLHREQFRVVRTPERGL